MRDGKRRARRFGPECVALDARTLPSAGVTASLARGVLTILGTPGDDTITVRVVPGGPRAAVVALEGGPRFRAGQVQRIVVRSFDGDDRITVTQTSRTLVPTRIVAGDGDNTIRTSAEFDDIVVGDGDNVVASGGGRDRIQWGTGRNVINGVPRRPPTTPGPTPPPGGPVVFPPTPTPKPTPPPVSSDPVSALERAIIDLVNQHRAAAGLAPLRVNQRLSAAAQTHGANMARLDQFGHVLPNTTTPSPVDRMRAVGYEYGSCGENIAYNYQGAEDVVSGWMGSPGHRANILNADYTETGVAVRFNAEGEPYYVQVFGSPL